MDEYVKVYGLFCFFVLICVQFYCFGSLTRAYAKEKRWFSFAACALFSLNSVVLSACVLFKLYEREVYMNMVF